MSYYRAYPAKSSRDSITPKIKPGTTSRGTPSQTHPAAPVVPQGGHGPPSGGIGKFTNPPKTKGGTPNPIITPVAHVDPAAINPHGRPPPGIPPGMMPPSHGILPPGIGRDPRFPPGDGRDRGRVPHPMHLPSDTDRFHKEFKPQRGRGENTERFRDRVGFRSPEDDGNCNRGVHHGTHFEFRMCDQNHRFLGLGQGDRIEDAIENARRSSGFFGNIFDFDRGNFFPFQNFINSVPIVPFSSQFSPQFQQPFPFPQQQPYPYPSPAPYPYPPIQSPYMPYAGTPPVYMPSDLGMSMGMSPNPDMAMTMPMDMGMTMDMGTGATGFLDNIKQTLMQNGITPTMLIIGVGLVVLVLVVKKK